MSTGINSRVWFYYANDQQVGPLPQSEMKKAVHNGVIVEDDFVYREGFHDWKPLREVPELLGNESTVRSEPYKSESAASRAQKTASASSDASASRATHQTKLDKTKEAKRKDRRTQPRAEIKELVVAHNDTHIATGALTDISISGVFFKTKETCFSINDELKVTLKEGKGLGKPLHLRGTVVRQSKENGQLTGYGLELKNLDERTRSSIIEYVKRHQAF